jgi:hypothetical protein
MQFHAHISLAAIASGGAVLHRKFLIRSIAFYGDLVQCQLIVAVGWKSRRRHGDDDDDLRL